MQFFIKKFYDYESKIKIEERKLAINIDNNDMIIESTRQKDENGNFIELFKKRIIGWHNIQIKDKEYRKYTSDSMNYIEVHTDILFKTNGEYKIIHYVFGIRPLLTYDVYGFFDYLKEYTANSLTDEQLKMIEKVKLLELEEKQKRKKEREERKI